MDDELHKLKSRSFLSVISLLINSSYSAVLGFAAFFVLTLKSGVHLLGIYTSVLAMMSFFNYFTDLGLAAALIQKKDVDDTDLSTAFFIQFVLVAITVTAGFLFTSRLFTFYKTLPKDAVYLYWSLLFSFFLLSFKSIPSVLLEKKLKIYKVVFVQALENTVFYISVIVLSLLGFQIIALVVAVLIRSIIGLTAIYRMNPWLPKPLFSFMEAKKLLKFGIPYQGNSFLALIKDDLLTIYLGGLLGLTSLGYITFAKKYAEFSIRFVMDNINRVAFPLFSNVRANASVLRKSIEKVLFYQSSLIFPFIIGGLFIFDSLIKIIPGYYAKWSPVLFSFYFFSFSSLFVSLSTPFINFFNATGRIKYTLVFMVTWIVLIWILVLFFVKLFGFNGVSVGFFVMSLTFVFVIATAKSFINFSLISSFAPAVVSVLVMSFFLAGIRILFVRVYPNIYLHVAISLILGFLSYSIPLYIIKGQTLITELIPLINKKRVEK